MDAELYSKAVYLTLKNKLLMLKNYIQITPNSEYKNVLSAITNEFKDKIDECASKFTDFGNEFAKSIEYINKKFSIEFRIGAKRLKIQYANTNPRKNSKKNKLDSEELEKELSSYNSRYYRRNRECFGACYDNICSLYKKITANIKIMLDYYDSVEGIEEVNNELKAKDIYNKLDLMNNIINDIPLLGLNQYELETLSGLMKRTAREANSINANQKASQNVNIKEISNLVFLKPKSKVKSKRLYTSPKKQDSEKIEDFPGHTENYAEYDKLVKSCNYIVSELREIQKNQFTLDSLMTNFLKKDEILLEFRQKCTDIPEAPVFNEPEEEKKDKCRFFRLSCKGKDKSGFCKDKCDPYCFYGISRCTNNPNVQVEWQIRDTVKYKRKRLYEKQVQKTGHGNVLLLFPDSEGYSRSSRKEEVKAKKINRAIIAKKLKKIKQKYRRLFRLVSPYARIVGGRFPKPAEYPVRPVKLLWLRNWKISKRHWYNEKDPLHSYFYKKLAQSEREYRRLFRLVNPKEPKEAPLKPVKLKWLRNWKIYR